MNGLMTGEHQKHEVRAIFRNYSATTSAGTAKA
jgi:hypothetical protein